MRQEMLVGVMVAAVLGAGAAGYWMGHHRFRTDSSDRPSTQATHAAHAAHASRTDTGHDSARKVLYWRDPMVPGSRFDKPGKSPFMDMPLEPVYADEQVPGTVSVDPDRTRSLGIRMGTVKKSVLSRHLRAVGSIAFDEHRLEVVQARVDWYVERLHLRAPLDRVRRGEPLADLVAPQWFEAEQEYLALLGAQSPGAQSLREAARQRLVVLGVPEPAIRLIETTRTASRITRIAAPLDGVVTELGVRQGSAFLPGTNLFRINGTRVVWADARIPEEKMAMVRVGSRVEANATGWPGIAFGGRVVALLPEVDPQTRTLGARVRLENKDQRLVAGMYVTVEFTGPAEGAQLVVPSEAIISTGERHVVIVAGEGGRFEAVEVTPGTESGGQTAILTGLSEGQSVVLSGQFLIDSEASLSAAIERLR